MSLLTCGFDFARFSILIHASSLSFHLAFSLKIPTKQAKPLETASGGNIYTKTH